MAQLEFDCSFLCLQNSNSFPQPQWLFYIELSVSTLKWYGLREKSMATNQSVSLQHPITKEKTNVR